MQPLKFMQVDRCPLSLAWGGQAWGGEGGSGPGNYWYYLPFVWVVPGFLEFSEIRGSWGHKMKSLPVSSVRCSVHQGRVPRPGHGTPGLVMGVGWAPLMPARPGAGPGLQTCLRLGVSVAAQSHLAGSEEHGGPQWSQGALEGRVGKRGWSGIAPGPPGGPKGQAHHLSLCLPATCPRLGAFDLRHPGLHVPGPRGVFPSGASVSVFGSAQCTCGTLRALWPSSSSLFLVDAEAPNKPELSPHPAPAHVWALRGSCRGSQGGRVAGALVLRSTGKCHSPSPNASSPDPPERSTPLTHFRLPPPEVREDAGWCFQRLCLCRFVTVAERNECSVGTHPGLTGELLGQGQSQAPYP